MLLEQLAQKAAEPPEHDWESYYRWLFGTLSGSDAADFGFWLCRNCHTVNLAPLPAKYGKCRGCDLIHLP